MAGGIPTLAYFTDFYLQKVRGISFLPTRIATIAAVVILLSSRPRNTTWYLQHLLLFVLSYAFHETVTAALYPFADGFFLDKISLLILLVTLSLFISTLSPRDRLVRSVAFFAGHFVVLSISEPLGEYMRNINENNWQWAQHLTWITVVILLFLFVFFLRRFSPPDSRSVSGHTQFVLLLCVVCSMIVLSQVLFQLLAGTPRPDLIALNYKQYNQAISLFLFIIELLTYYLYYSVITVSLQNQELLSVRQKEAMEEEKYQANRVNYEDLRMLRHELKNHDFYVRSLVDAGKYDELTAYLDSRHTATLDRLQSFDCGNYMVDVVINHAVNEARQLGIEVRPQIIVPHTLPYEDSDICSLLSNLLDNAMEAARQSGAAHPSVEISILPRNDYLFIRVTNDLDLSVPVQERLTLRTTKQQQYHLHGFGTKVIKRIAEKYHGSVKFDIVDDRFVVDVMLDLPHATEESVS